MSFPAPKPSIRLIKGKFRVFHGGSHSRHGLWPGIAKLHSRKRLAFPLCLLHA